jgi:hypothetical protein
MAALTSAEAQTRNDPVLKVINASRSRALHGIFATVPSVNTFGQNLLGNYVSIPAGSYIYVTIPSGGTCIVDLMAVANDGQSTQRYNTNVCGAADWTIYDK